MQPLPMGKKFLIIKKRTARNEVRKKIKFLMSQVTVKEQENENEKEKEREIEKGKRESERENCGWKGRENRSPCLPSV